MSAISHVLNADSVRYADTLIRSVIVDLNKTKNEENYYSDQLSKHYSTVFTDDETR